MDIEDNLIIKLQAIIEKQEKEIEVLEYVLYELMGELNGTGRISNGTYCNLSERIGYHSPSDKTRYEDR